MLYGRSDVWTVTTDGAIKVLTNSDEHSYAGAQFSPDGTWILSTRSTSTDAVIRKKMNNGGPVDLVVIPAAGGKEINLTETWDYLPQGAFWSKDGKHVYFTGGIGGTTHLFRVSVPGGVVEQVTSWPAAAQRLQLRSRIHEDGVSGRHVRGAVRDLRRELRRHRRTISSRTCTTRSRARSRSATPSG